MALKSATRNYWSRGVALVTSIVSAVITYFLLTRIDLVVHVELYNFGLHFSAEWADSYRTYVLLIYVCLVLTIVLSSSSLFFSFTAKETQKEYQKPPKTKEEAVHEVEQRVSPQSITREELKALGSDDNMQTCPKCNKGFSRPIVMLDFSDGKPKLVNSCPYCNHVLD